MVPEMFSDVASLLGKVYRYARTHLYQKEVLIVYEKRIDDADEPMLPKAKDIVFSKIEDLSQKHFQRLSSINRHLTLSDFIKDVAAGHECLVGSHRETGKVVFYVWTRTRSSREAEAGMHPAYAVTDAKEVHFFSAFTSPSFRGNNIYPSGISHLARHYGKLGYNKLTCSVATNNESSLRGIRKLGFLPTPYRITATTLFFRQTRRLSRDERKP